MGVMLIIDFLGFAFGTLACATFVSSSFLKLLFGKGEKQNTPVDLASMKIR